MSLRIIFMGTPEFAVASLDMLVKNKFNVISVVTAPDKPSGRGQQMQISAVKAYALQHNLPLMQPDNLKAEEFLNALSLLKADLQLVVAFRMLPEKVWNMPPEGTYNLHASLLPKYRGAAPINWAIINGETESGVTTFKLKHEIDTGNILFKERVPISETDTAGNLHDVLKHQGAQLLLKTAQAIEEKRFGKGILNFTTQENIQAPVAPKIFKEICRIKWEKPGKDIYNLVRGLSPHPTAFTSIKSRNGDLKSLKIFYVEFHLEAHQMAPGAIVTDNKSYLKVFTIDGLLNLLEVQIEGKKRMPISEFLKGFKIEDKMVMV